ncbi:MAG: hypothetical protein KAI66_21030, partial [Lentisphaeria bacterium]|nr:hypothetical protein [Lentisphaeria bacterium]
SDGSFYCVYRSVDGHPVCCYSRDGGHTWSTPRYKQFADGRRMRHPRAANFVWKCANGNFLYWFHNHGGSTYEDRNPVWLCGGRETDGPDGRVIQWSQPEIVLYDDDTFIRMSYPDLVEEDGRYYLTETQKDKARVHEIDPALLEGMWTQFDTKTRTENGLLLESHSPHAPNIEMRGLPPFCVRDTSRADYGTRRTCAGFAVEIELSLDQIVGGQVALDARTQEGRGLAVLVTERRTVEIVLNDGRMECRWDCDQDLLEEGRVHHVTIIVDSGPKIITFVVDGALCDGGVRRQFGWGRFSEDLRGVDGASSLRVGEGLSGTVHAVRIYDRPLRTSEAIGNWRATL